MELFGLNLGLGGIHLLSDAQTRSISAENPKGSRTLCGHFPRMDSAFRWLVGRR